MSPEPVRVLLIEDDPADAEMIARQLPGGTPPLTIEHASTLAAGLARQAEGPSDIALLDLSLPDSLGLATLIAFRTECPNTPVVVLTGLGDEDTGVGAVHAGAQDYLVKGEVTPPLLVRAIRYALERHRLQAGLEQARYEEGRRRDLEWLQLTARRETTSVTARSYGVEPLRESSPGLHRECVRRYGGLIDLALEERAYKVEHGVSKALRALAEQMGSVWAGPRDLMHVATEALQERTEGLPAARARACVEESRFMVLELVGDLAKHYRSRALPAGRADETPVRPPSAEGEGTR